MSRRRVTVEELAVTNGIDCEIALLMLQEAGFHIGSITDVISKSKYATARRILELPSEKDLRSTVSLANKFNMTELELREKLIKAKLIRPYEARVARKKLKALKAILVPRLSVPSPPPESSSRQAEVLETKALVAERLRKKKIARPPCGFRWRIIGCSEDMQYLRPGDVEAIHYKLVEDFAKGKDPIVPAGVRTPSLLESAVNRPHTSLGELIKYPSISMAGSALLHALIHNHPFHNGNKRTGLVALFVFLDKNGYVLTAKDDELFDYVIRVSAHGLVDSNGSVGGTLSDYEMQDMAKWLQRKIKRIRKGEQIVKFGRLKQIPGNRGCAFDVVPGNRINIRCGSLHTQVFYANDGRDVDPSTVHKIRRDLHLDEAHGYDSDIFYNEGDRIDVFINKYRKVLDQLARL